MRISRADQRILYRGFISEMLGRPLRNDEDVHHINGNHDDDRPENLMVMFHKEHFEHHRSSAVVRRGHLKFRYPLPTTLRYNTICPECNSYFIHGGYGLCVDCYSMAMEGEYLKSMRGMIAIDEGGAIFVFGRKPKSLSRERVNHLPPQQR